ncbi:hypothetical protein A3Q56_03189 [Intoshia linei]|uniref:Sodium-and chloride-dependent glycine transporter 2 n=1 Tax=Intoshia linei TaxID=1819745 RepID=A0A177B5T3_9BILA|nr:hypothetical protein A3Q56_03189 [Intoshia linei]
MVIINISGAFLIPYATMLLTAGIPLFFLELSFGQYGRSGVVSIWSVSPLFSGNVSNHSVLNLTYVNALTSEDKLPGITQLGGISWSLAICLFVAWLLVCVCLIRGIQSLGKVVYFTAIFPYIVITCLLITILQYDGSSSGIKTYLAPDFKRMLSLRVWGDAAVQIFFSLSPCWGGLITLATYNKVHNNCLRDAIIVSVLNCLTSFYAGFVVYGVLGYLAFSMQKKMEDIFSSGAGLAFIVYPEALDLIPASQVWSCLFFMMLISLGLGTQFSIVSTVHTTIKDLFPLLFESKKKSALLMFIICTAGFLLGLPLITQNGMYLFQVMDNYAASYAVIIVGILECVVISHIYGLDTFYKNIKMMLGYHPTFIWRIMWGYITPAMLCGILAFMMSNFGTTQYNGRLVSYSMEMVGWIMASISILIIPIIAIIKILTFKDKTVSIKKRIQLLVKATDEFGKDAEIKNKEQMINENIEDVDLTEETVSNK